MIALQATAAQRLAPRNGHGAETRQALADVETTARQALSELRQLGFTSAPASPTGAHPVIHHG